MPNAPSLRFAHDYFILGIVAFVAVLSILAMLGYTQESSILKNLNQNLIGSAHKSNSPRGYVDVLNHDYIAGWAYDPQKPSEPVNIQIRIDKASHIIESPANLPREDVNNAFGISGNHGFHIPISDFTYDGKRHSVRIYILSGSKAIPLNKYTLSASTKPNHADFISQNVPDTMVAGQVYNISISVKNIGTGTWSEDANYRLGSQNPENNGIWGVGRIYLTDGEAIAPGQIKNFTFQVKAPAQPGTYDFQWRMVQELVEWFGKYAPNVRVAVTPPTEQLKGYVDIFTADKIIGWAFDPAEPATSISAGISVDGVLIATVPADMVRPDVNQAFNITGNHQFYYEPSLSPGTHEVVVTAVNGAKRTELRRGTIIGEVCTYHIVSDSATRIVPSGAAVETWTHGAWAPVTQQFSATNAQWIWNAYNTQSPVSGETVHLEKIFEVPGTPAEGSLRITVDDAYQAYLNGQFIGNGSDWTTTEMWNVSHYLKQGKNNLTITATNRPIPNSNAFTNPGGVIFALSVNFKGLCEGICGNGVIESGEQCDDGNAQNGDGCSSTCQNENLKITVDMWEYWIGDSTKSLCLGPPSKPLLCRTTTRVSEDAVVIHRTDKAFGKFVRDKHLVSAVTDGSAGSHPSIICVSDAAADCGPLVTPMRGWSRIIDAPILSVENVTTQRVTPGAQVLAMFETIHVNPISADTCVVSSQSAGAIGHSLQAFMLNQVDFGGDIGVRKDILVIEGVSGYPPGQTNPWGGARLERYWLDKEHGHLREEGWDDPDCRSHLSIETCDGNFTQGAPGTSTWKYVNATPTAFVELCPIVCPNGEPNCAGELKGYVDVLTAQNVVGWAYATGSPTSPVNIRIEVDGGLVAIVPTNGWRGDVNEAFGIGGWHGFSHTFSSLSPGPHTVKVIAHNGNKQKVLAEAVVAPEARPVNLWEYAGGIQPSTLCLGTAQSDLCQTTYPQTPDRYLYMRNDKLMQYMIKNETRGIMGILRDGDLDGGAGTPEGIPWTRCLSDAPGRCDAAVTPYRSIPLHAELPVLSANDVRTNYVTSKGKPFTLKGVVYVNYYDTASCTPYPTAAGNATVSTNFFILDSYDFGGDLGVQKNVLVYEGVGPVMPVNNPNPWGAITIERYWFVKGKGVVREEGYWDQDCADNPSVQTCNGVFMKPSPGTSTWKHIRSTLMPMAETCPICPPGQPGCEKQRTINTWEYIIGNSSKRMCVPENQDFCFTRGQPAPNRSMNRRTDTTMGLFIRTPSHIGVFKDGAFDDHGSSWLRCFGDAPGTCEASHPPFQLPHTLTVPVLPSSALDVSRITPGGTRVKTFASFSIYHINPTTCQVSATSAGSISASAQAFLLESYDFGGNLGVQTDVLVYEDVAGFLPEATNPWGGLILERYFLVKGLGHVGEEARIDPDCQAAQSTTTCNGVFSQKFSGFARWSIHKTPPVPVFESCGPGATGAAFVSQSVPNVMEPGKKYNVSVTIRNTGGAIWNATKNYRLGAQSPQDNTVWGVSRVMLSPTDKIVPGQEKTFTFTVTAPQQPGTYSFQWQMLQELVTWFGEKSPPLLISVQTSGTPQVWTFGSTDQQDGTFFGPNDIAIMPDGRIVVSDWVNQQVQVFSPTFQFLTRFGKPGGEEQENNDMLSVAVSHDGRIFSADIFSAVKEFGSDYKFIRRHNFAPGAENDPNARRFNFPHLAFDRTVQDNYVYIADQNNNRVLRLTRMTDGSLGDMRIFRGVNNEITAPRDVAVATINGVTRVYILNGDNTVRVYKNPFGAAQLLATLSGMFTYAGSVAVSPSNNRLYVADLHGHNVHIFALGTLTYLMPFGSKGTGNGQFDSPQGLAVDSAGNLYVVESGNNRIQKFTSEGAFLGKFGSRNPTANGKFHRAGSTAYDPIAHEVYVGDIYNCRIQVFDEQGNFRRVFGRCAQTFNMGGEYHGPDLSYIGDFDIDPTSGRIYIADSFNQRIAIYKMDGTFLFSFGSAGRGPGQFDNPLMLEVSNGKLYVGDWGDFLDGQLDGRVQTFSLSGEYLSMLAPNGNTEGKVNQPVGIFDDPRNGRIFVSDAHRYTNIYGSDGQYLQRFRIVNEQTGIPVHGDGFIEQDGDMWLTTGSDRIERWNADTLTRISTFGSHGDAIGQFRYPSKPSIGRNGEIYIGDWNDRVTVSYP